MNGVNIFMNFSNFNARVLARVIGQTVVVGNKEYVFIAIVISAAKCQLAPLSVQTMGKLGGYLCLGNVDVLLSQFQFPYSLY